jgi:hypothetical protein
LDTRQENTRNTLTDSLLREGTLNSLKRIVKFSSTPSIYI